MLKVTRCSTGRGSRIDVFESSFGSLYYVDYACYVSWYAFLGPKRFVRADVFSQTILQRLLMETPQTPLASERHRRHRLHPTLRPPVAAQEGKKNEAPRTRRRRRLRAWAKPN